MTHNLWSYCSIFFVVWWISSCNASPRQGEAPAPGISSTDTISVPTGVRIAVPFVHQPSDSFEVIVPGGWRSGLDKAVVFFDPHGEASLPLTKYQNINAELGLLSVSCKQLHNDIPINSALDIAAELLQSIHARFKPQDIYLCGFSGGAKIALLAGTSNSGVSRVIYSGSGIVFEPKVAGQTYFGIAGKKDMNYTELVELHLGMLSAGLAAVLLEWEGNHEWPNEASMRLALGSDLNSLPQGSWFVDSESKKLGRAKESQIKSFYLQSLETKDLNWWQQEINKLRKSAVQDKSGIFDRVLGFLSLACYSYSKRSLQSHDTGRALHLLNVYQLVDPENADAAFFFARYYWMMNKPDLALPHLLDAKKKGFSRWTEAEPGLLKLMNP